MPLNKYGFILSATKKKTNVERRAAGFLIFPGPLLVNLPEYSGRLKQAKSQLKHVGLWDSFANNAMLAKLSPDIWGDLMMEVKLPKENSIDETVKYHIR